MIFLFENLPFAKILLAPVPIFFQGKENFSRYLGDVKVHIEGKSNPVHVLVFNCKISEEIPGIIKKEIENLEKMINERIGKVRNNELGRRAFSDILEMVSSKEFRGELPDEAMKQILRSIPLLPGNGNIIFLVGNPSSKENKAYVVADDLNPKKEKKIDFCKN